MDVPNHVNSMRLNHFVYVWFHMFISHVDCRASSVIDPVVMNWKLWQRQTRAHLCLDSTGSSCVLCFFLALIGARWSCKDSSRLFISWRPYPSQRNTSWKRKCCHNTFGTQHSESLRTECQWASPWGCNDSPNDSTNQPQPANGFWARHVGRRTHGENTLKQWPLGVVKTVTPSLKPP